MKKIITLLLTFICTFALIAGFSVKTSAKGLLPVDEHIVVEGAQVKTSGDTGLRFVGSIDGFEDVEHVTKYGFVIATGEAEASDDFVIGGTVNGNDVSYITFTELDDNGKFYLVITNIPDESTGFKLSARAFVVKDDVDYVYGTESSCKNLLQTAIDASEDENYINSLSPEEKTSYLGFLEGIKATATNQKKWFQDIFQSIYIDGALYESIPGNLYKAFAKYWNTFFEKEIKGETVKAIKVDATRAEMGDQIKNALEGSIAFDKNDNIIKFFTNEAVYDKWSWFLDYLGANGGNPVADASLIKQIEIIKEAYENRKDTKWEGSITLNHWYRAYNLITYMADYFSQSDYSAFINETGITYYDSDSMTEDYRSFFASVLDYNNKIAAADGQFIAIGEDFKFPATTEKVGYTGFYKDAEDDDVTYEIGGTYAVTKDDKLFLVDYRLTDYTITYNLDNGSNSNSNPSTYTIKDDKIVFEDATKTGYTFKGWYSDSSFTTKVTNVVPGVKNDEYHADIVLYAKFTPNDNTVVYHLNDSTKSKATNLNPDPTIVATDAKYTLLGAKRIGYEFAGWYTSSDLAEDSAVTILIGKATMEVYAKWVEETYDITYDLDNGTNSESNPSTYTINSNEITFEDASKTGYTFIGWYSDAKCTEGNEVTKIESGSNGDVALYAKFEANDVTVTFNHNDPKTVIAYYNEFVADVKGLCGTHHFADSYYSNFYAAPGANGENSYYYDYLPLSNVLKSTAPDCADFRTKYAPLFKFISEVRAKVGSDYVNEIKGFNTAGVKSADAIYIFSQELKNMYNVVLNASYDMKGYTNASLVNYEMYDWATDSAEFYLTLKEETKSADSNKTLKVDAAISYVPTRPGYKFVGWNTAKDGTGSMITTVPTDDITLYAVWEQLAE